MNDKSNALLPITGDFPPEFVSVAEFCVYLSPGDWEIARARYATYRLLVDACKKSVLAFDTFYRAVPPDVTVTRDDVVKWRDDIAAANEIAITALYKALIAVEEAG